MNRLILSLIALPAQAETIVYKASGIGQGMDLNPPRVSGPEPRHHG